ncbi:DUF3067 domain-containing protein [Skeletonema marinoi]|uniref:DUF3067 domain-containing protein n=1 Tax=Skeletonema marinoi TaxID=267567 RepID=A0AAD8YA04_9STRA|nr:DUF3067 domain-containing protein [Skeletonema marinoi]
MKIIYATIFLPAAAAFVATSTPRRIQATFLQSSPFDEFLGNIFGKDEDKDKSRNKDSDIINDEEINISSFQQELTKRQQQQPQQELETDIDNAITDANKEEEEEEFDGYKMRDAIYNKFGECFDVDFNKVDAYGFRSVYLNIMPFRLGGKRFRHETELDYLCHLQAVVSTYLGGVEILQKYDQLDYVLAQLDETTKKPRAGTSPLIAVPLRLDLTEEQVNQIMG